MDDGVDSPVATAAELSTRKTSVDELSHSGRQLLEHRLARYRAMFDYLAAQGMNGHIRTLARLLSAVPDAVDRRRAGRGSLYRASTAG